MPRFQRDVFDKNLELVRELQKLAARKGCTTGQIGLGWVWKLSGRNGLPTIIPIPGSTTEERVAENLTEIELSEEDLKEIDDILKRVVVVGSRYGGEAAKFADG